MHFEGDFVWVSGSEGIDLHHIEAKLSTLHPSLVHILVSFLVVNFIASRATCRMELILSNFLTFIAPVFVRTNHYLLGVFVNADTEAVVKCILEGILGMAGVIV